ncbi:hypothetical protein F971_01166 [Acinetobacter vivianii]|uniref:Uncharacterized protein n=1 Tax=Acinetobacter vivianii TaxID=1776742 RepID=N8UZY2_9GAMM|nr:O-antigen ligase family protein [Acinetobacter vivianii]ENU93126.1 hypothetical protein F971_01166 [Acinetobacter vivianii]
MKIFGAKEKFLYILVSISFLYGILSFQHYSPSFHDFYIHAFVFLFLNIGLFIYFFNQEVKIYVNNFLWLLIFFTILVQPIFNKIIYIDGLIYPLAIALSILFLSIAISNLNNKKEFTVKMAFTIILGAIFLQLTQSFHILKLNFWVEMMHLPLQVDRFSGNLFQPNQTAFIFIMAVISVIYFFRNLKSYLIEYILIFIFSLGVAFTVSRSGFLILFSCVLFFNVYYNFINNIKILNLKYFFVSILGLISGTLLYPYFSNNLDIVNRTQVSLDDPRTSLFHRTWLIIKEHPFMGVGWKNFSSAGLEHFNELRWFSSTDHSHFIFGQLLSEFGLLGMGIILLFLIIFTRNIKIRNIEQLYIFTIILIVIFYSMFEFPLWQLRYLIVFSIFLSLFDQSDRVFLLINKSYIFVIFSLIFSLLSIYYIFEYKKTSYLYDYVLNENVALEDKVEKVSKIEPVFGFGFFNDLIVYEVLSNGNFELDKKIEIGNRLVHYIPNNVYLVRHARNLAEAKHYESSKYFFSASCHYNFGRECDRTKKYLKDLAVYDPENFKDICEYIALKYK